MFQGELKPLLTALLVPPAGPLLLALLGVFLMMGRRRLGGALLGITAIATLWFLSCNAVGIVLADSLLPRSPPLDARGPEMAAAHAIVVLGGGVLARAPEYGQAQPAAATLERLRYGAWLARQSHKPLAFAGGVGWAATGTEVPPEAEVAARMLQGDYGLALRWADSRSRDTAEGARMMAGQMQGDRIRRIALVTHATHMPRSVLAFEKAGFQVTPAPIDFAQPRGRSVVEWLPSLDGLALSRSVLREWLGIRMGAY